MTPAARYAAAIELLDAILDGEAAERALTRWGRENRYAGSGDRAAIRDHVFDALRCRRSLAALGGGETGRALVLGLLRGAGIDPSTIFTGERHAPAPLTQVEAGYVPPAELPPDLPDWLVERFEAALGPDATAAIAALRHRAPVHLRVNIARIERADAALKLAREGVETLPHPLARTALVVVGPARGLRDTAAFREGLVELQDASSQMAVLALPLTDGDRVLDFCAGGGGKALAIGARARIDLVAHDADPGRMADLRPRAARAGLAIQAVAPAALARLGAFDLVFVDAPCSGSGTWRRTPEAKSRLTPENLAALTRSQDHVLAEAARFVRPTGRLAYATCSVLIEENEERIAAFLATSSGWTKEVALRLSPGELHDGFYLQVLLRDVHQP
jgi:16S rRNA (cytosine967-C5)-methyltransferase